MIKDGKVDGRDVSADGIEIVDSELDEYIRAIDSEADYVSREATKEINEVKKLVEGA